MIVFWTVTVPPLAMASPPPETAKFALIVSFVSWSAPVKGPPLPKSTPPPMLPPPLFSAAFAVIVVKVDRRAGGARAGGLDLDTPALPAAHVVGDGAVRHGQVAPLAKMPPPVPPVELSLISLLLMVVPGRRPGCRRRCRWPRCRGTGCSTTVSVPWPFWSPKPPPTPPEKLSASVLFVMVTAPLPALPIPPPAVRPGPGCR